MCVCVCGGEGVKYGNKYLMAWNVTKIRKQHGILIAHTKWFHFHPLSEVIFRRVTSQFSSEFPFSFRGLPRCLRTLKQIRQFGWAVTLSWPHILKGLGLNVGWDTCYSKFLSVVLPRPWDKSRLPRLGNDHFLTKSFPFRLSPYHSTLRIFSVKVKLCP